MAYLMATNGILMMPKFYILPPDYHCYFFCENTIHLSNSKSSLLGNPEGVQLHLHPQQHPVHQLPHPLPCYQPQFVCQSHCSVQERSQCGWITMLVHHARYSGCHKKRNDLRINYRGEWLFCGYLWGKQHPILHVKV